MDRKALKARARESLERARGNYKVVTLLLLVALVALAGLEWGAGELASRTSSGSHYLSQSLNAGYRAYLVAMVASLVCQFLMAILGVSYQSVALRLSREEEFGNDTLLDGFRIWSRCILLYVYMSLLLGLWSGLASLPVSYLMTALYLAGTVTEDMIVAVMMGFMTLAMVALSYRYRMAYFILLDDPEKPVRQIVTEAKNLNKVHRWRLFQMDLSFVPWALLCALTCGVLLIWKLPYMAAAYAHAYEFMCDDYDIREQRLEALLEEQRKWLQEHDL